MCQKLGLKVKLNNDVEVPLIGMGSSSHYPAVLAKTKDWVIRALKVTSGIRAVYLYPALGNEKGIGEVIRESGIPREEIFVTTKLQFTHHSRVKEGFEESLDALGIDYIDAYLMHWPASAKYDPQNPWAMNPDGTFNLLNDLTLNDVWAEMEKLLDTGKVRAIGVSNFSIKTLEKLLTTAKVIPALCQVEMHPYLAENALRHYCEKKGIVLTAYTPSGTEIVRNDPLIVSLAEKYKITPYQVIVAWHVSRGNVFLPTSKNPERQKENFEVIKTLSEEDLAKIWSLDRGQRVRILPDAKGSVFGWTIEQLGWDNYPSHK